MDFLNYATHPCNEHIYHCLLYSKFLNTLQILIINLVANCDAVHINPWRFGEHIFSKYTSSHNLN
jgi:hypothetical protein